MAAKILHKKSNTVTNGVPSLPSPSILDYGEIAINYHAGNETISIKNDAGNIATFKSSAQLEGEYVAKSGDTMDTGATLVLKHNFPDEGDGSTAYTNTISGSGISITDDWGSSVDLSKFGLSIQHSWYGSCVGLDYEGISFGSSPMVVKVLSFPQTGGTIALTSDIPQPVSALTSACTHSEVPSAKVVYDTIVDNEYVVATAINTLHTEQDDVSNKATAITSSATQTQYPSAKAVHDAIDGITGLPAVTAADNGKILKVVNGAWALVDPVTIYSGASAPSSDLGEDGDIYLQTS